jgi:hypothetical protein
VEKLENSDSGGQLPNLDKFGFGILEWDSTILIVNVQSN